VGAAFVLCTLAFACLSPALAKANLYMFLTNALYISTDGAPSHRPPRRNHKGPKSRTKFRPLMGVLSQKTRAANWREFAPAPADDSGA
jgi:hypothetical protein